MVEDEALDHDQRAVEAPRPSPLLVAAAAELPPDLQSLDGLLALLALPPLAVVRTAQCPRARDVARAISRTFNRSETGRQIAAVQACYNNRTCCKPGHSSTLALGLELRLAAHGDKYGSDPIGLINQVQAVRQLVGDLLYRHAQILDYRAPSAAAASSRMAGVYLAHSVGRQTELDVAPSGSDWTRARLAASIVTRSRYQPGSKAELDWVMRVALQLLASEQPAKVRTARELLAQASLVLLPRGPVVVPDALWDGLPQETAGNESLLVRLAQLALTLGDSGRPEHVNWGLQVLESVYIAPDSPRMFRLMAGVLLAWQATTEQLGSQAPSLVGLRHLFDFPRHIAHAPRQLDLALVTHTFIAHLGQRLSDNTSAMYLHLLAGLYDTLGNRQVQSGALEEAATSYRAALDAGSLSERHSMDESLRVAQRHFELARLKQDSQALELGLRLLDGNAADRQYSAQPYLALARQMERGGLPRLTDWACAIEGAHDCATAQYVAGNADAAYAAAGRRALRNSTMRRLSLGGRSGTEMPLSLSNFSASSSVVIKRTTPAKLKRELAALEKLQAASTSSWDWRTAHFVGSESIDPSSEDMEATVAAFWQWTDGTTAATYLLDNPHRTPHVLERLSRALAELHLGLEPGLGAVRCAPPKVRRYYLQAQVGMWLRQLKPDGYTGRSPSEVFNAWFEAHAGLSLPWTPRTDAHLENWVVEDEEEGIVRLDLEAFGWAPFAYELAQLTDDFPLLGQSAEAWTVRRACFLSYMQALDALDGEAQEAAAWESYLLSLVIRASRPLSGGLETEKSLGALDLLEAVAARTASALVVELCGDFRQAWERRRSEPTTAISDVLVELFEPSAQIRASKRLAHLLRHNENVVRDEHGWVDIEVVVEHLTAMRDYARLPQDELYRFVITLVQRFEEARFEYREGRIRARYGQSVPVGYPARTGVEAAAARPRLFHGTSYAAVASIFAKGGRLQPMSRSWVHLSTDVAEAVRVGSRHGEPIVLELPETLAGVGEAIQAGEHTWVIAEVPNTALRIVPLQEFPPEAFRLPPVRREG